MNLIIVLYLTIQIVTGLGVETTIPDLWDCNEYKYWCQPAGHIVLRDLKNITIQDFSILYVRAPYTRFLIWWTSTDVVKKLLMPNNKK